ncbi:MAG TPA: helix-turn-helix domain-containing protein, partial [Candidatus Thermoplasmatota archaeon]|nr:helix-turn-helix domain-containing protein [Candidatus Thermoplasmatota archaeon]
SQRVQAGTGSVPTAGALPVTANLDVRLDSRSGSSKATTAANTMEVAATAEAPVNADLALLAGAAVALTGLVVSFWAQIKSLLTKLLIVPLYAHIERGEVFDNPVRERLFQLVKADPGVSATELSERAGVSWGTTLYHLNVLEQNRMVVGVKHGRYLRYFENGARKDGDAQCVLRNTTTARVQDAVAASAGRTQKELADLLGMSPQALHWHLRRLEGAGLVTKVKEGRVVRHYAATVIASPLA